MQKSFQGLVPQPPYPWLDDLWRQFVERSRSNKVPHAILISGKGGSGEFDLGYAMAQFLLCASPTALSACGACKSCRLMQSDAHPDLVSVCPEEKSTVIKIDAIRSVAAFVANTAQQGGKKLVVLGPAESMNANAANALLKNLEEPSGDTTFILVSSNPLLLMATIRSRCSQWVVRSPTAAQSVEWLERNSVTDAEAKLNLTGGEPLRVMEWVEKGLYEQSEALERLTGQYVDGHLDLVQAAKKRHQRPRLRLLIYSYVAKGNCCGGIIPMCSCWLRNFYLALKNANPVTLYC